MRTQTTNLYIVQRGEIADTCSAPWCPSIRASFESQYRRMKSFEERTALVEASNDNEAFDKYMDQMKKRLPYEEDESLYELQVACRAEIKRSETILNHIWR